MKRSLFLTLCVLTLLCSTVVLAFPARRYSSNIVVTHSDSQNCPAIKLNGPDTINEGETLAITASVKGGDPNVSPTYNWAVSAGSILSGQGTSSIQIETKGLGDQTVTATVDLGGYDRNCSTTSSVSTDVTKKPLSRKVGGYGKVTAEQEQKALDNFAMELQENPLAQAYVVSYGGKNEADAEAKRAKDHLIKRLIDSTKITTVNGGQRDKLEVELWLVPSGAAPPATQKKP
ncbi:MAG TPA: hypothetical protein VFC63_07810 [Blastocatellia bacterium]|nr:hypothetical protein [Blastocatellia bacterium]